MSKGKEAIAMELVGWMLSGQQGTMTYVCLSAEDAKEIYNHAVDILKGILLKIRWEDAPCENDKE